MDWFKKHADTVSILAAFGASILWMNSQFGAVDAKFAKLEQEIAIVKTVLIMSKVMPVELAHQNNDVMKK